VIGQRKAGGNSSCGGGDRGEVDGDDEERLKSFMKRDFPHVDILAILGFSLSHCY